MISNIGENAGKVWTLLNKNGVMSTSKLKTNLKLSETDLNLSIGWLAREDKISIATGLKDSISVSLK